MTGDRHGPGADDAAWTVADLVDALDHLPSAIGAFDAGLYTLYRNYALHDLVRRLGLDPFDRGLLREPGPGYESAPGYLPTAVDEARRALTGERRRVVQVMPRPDGGQERWDFRFERFTAVEGGPESILALGSEVAAQPLAEVLDRDVVPLLAAAADDERAQAALRTELVDDLDPVLEHLDALQVSNPGRAPLLGQAASLVRAAVEDLTKVKVGRPAGAEQVSGAIERLARTAASRLHYRPSVVLRGSLERVSPWLAAELGAAVERGLADVGRRGGSTQAVVAVIVGRHDLTVTVVDDGAGPDDAPGGPEDLRQLAEHLGGACRRHGNALGGNVLDWRVPLTGSEPTSGAEVASERTVPVIEPPGSAGRAAFDVDVPWLRRMLDALPALVSVHDTATRFLLANSATQRWLATDQEAMLGRRMGEVMRPDAFVGLVPVVRGVLQGIPQQYERATVDGLGQARHVRAHFVPWLTAGVQRGYVCEVVDVTDEVEAQESVRRHLEGMTSAEERRRATDHVHADAARSLRAAVRRLDDLRDTDADPAHLFGDVARLGAAVGRLERSVTDQQRRPPAR